MRKEKKNSLILIAALLFIAAAAYFIMAAGKGRAAFVIVSSDGEEIIREEINRLKSPLKIESEYGYNILEVVELENGEKGIRCFEADCPEHICIETGIISDENDTIVCLPHKMTVRLVK